MKKRFLLSILIPLIFTLPSFAQTLEMYVCDGGNFNNPPWQILKFDAEGGSLDTFTNEQLGWPQDVLFLEDQGVTLISNLNTGRITKYDAATGEYLGNFATGIDGPTRMEIGSDSLLYVLQWQGNGKVLRYELDGTFVDEFTDVGVSQSIGLDWDSDGNLYVSSWNGATVRKFDSEGNDQGLFISSGLQGPTNVWFNDAGEMLVLNWSGTTAKRFDATGNFIDDFLTGLENPEGVAFYPNGNILIGNGGTHAVKLFDASGNFIEDIVPNGTGGLILPNAVILREVPETVSTSQIIEEAVFVQPTIGEQFYLEQELETSAKWVEVYDTTGILIDRRATPGNLIWDAGENAAGVYIIKIQIEEGKIWSQKVMVKH